MKVKIVKEVKRSDVLWRFACGDVLIIFSFFFLALLIKCDIKGETNYSKAAELHMIEIYIHQRFK